jgi:hypothetical protein
LTPKRGQYPSAQPRYRARRLLAALAGNVLALTAVVAIALDAAGPGSAGSERRGRLEVAAWPAVRVLTGLLASGGGVVSR